MSATARPNVLFMICDDLNTNIAGSLRVPFAATPHLQGLIDRGVRFERAFANCPICLPSRNSLYSGFYPHATGHFTLWDSWKTCTPIPTTAMAGSSDHGRAWLGQAVMMPEHFLRSGYRVFGAGKTLHAGRVDDRWWTEYSRGPDYGPGFFHGMTREMLDLCEGDPFDAYALRYGGLDRAWLDGSRFGNGFELQIASLENEFGHGREGATHGDRRTPFYYRNDEDRDALPDEKTADFGVDVLSRTHEEPFFLNLGFMKPHTPLNAPSRFFDLFDPDTLELPAVLESDLDDCARALVEHCPYGHLLFDLMTRDGENGWRKWLQAYLACVAFLDEQVGRVLQALEASPYRDNTIVVFTSDNGFHMGEKNYLYKNSLWEEGSGIPLIFSGPGVDAGGSVCGAPVSLIDLYPTLIDLCDLPANPNEAGHGRSLDGSSLRSLLADPSEKSWQGPSVALSSVRGNTGIHHSVRSRTHRYTLCQNGEEELYDHRADPHEWHNLARDPANAEIRHTLREELISLVFGPR